MTKTINFVRSLLLLAMTCFTLLSCEKEDTEKNNGTTEDPSNGITDDTQKLVDENGTTAKIDVTVYTYHEEKYPSTDEEGYYQYDENGELIYKTYQVPMPYTGKTVYMFNDEDVSDKSKALKKIITDINGTATFELTEDYFSDDNPAFYFSVFENDIIVGHGALNIKKGKESAIIIDTKGNSTGALYYYNLIKTYELHSIAEEYKMNVKARGNLMNDNISKIRIELPENTVSWYFSFDCVEKNGNNAVLGLFSALLKYFDPTKGLASDAIDQITQPKGSVDCNVYLEDKYGYMTPLISHISEGKMEIKQYIDDTYYLVFENPFLARGISINVDVVAQTIKR